MAADGGASSISVTVRVRPFTIREAAQLTKCDDGPFFLGDGSLAAVPTPKLQQKGLRSVIKVIDDKCLVFDPPEDNPLQRFSRSVVPSSGKRVKDHTFAFDRVFDDNTSQADVYEATTRGLLDSVLEGYNATVFAYGATGCGKTHTITGTAQQPGIIFLAMQELFERISERQADKDTEVSLSYLEIYNETIRDLLVPDGAKAGLMLREDANQSVSVAALSSHNPQNVQEVMDMIMKGNEQRTMSPTEANATSSRSHAVLQINVAQRDRNADVNEPHTMATLSIIDLAGSERASATKNRGERLLEGANINKSLLALGSCINALCDPRKKNHVPYRNSKLTRLLKFSLGGNCKTVMIVCVSPSSAHFDETQNTLRYANRAKNIQTKVTRNVYNVNRHVKDFLKKIDEQLAMINELKLQQKDYEATAFARFRRQRDKRDVVAREGIVRIRNAYDHSLAERREKCKHQKKLRQIERRIGVVSAWVAAFDKVCAAEEDERVLDCCRAMRRTAQGVLVELEGSRQHYHQRIAKSNWERALDTALQTGLRQLHDVDGEKDESLVASLTREAELLKSAAEREALAAVLEQDKTADAATVQILLEAHFDAVALVNRLRSMDEADAAEAADSVLNKILSASVDATNYIVHPDDRTQADEAFPPLRIGTPKRRKQARHAGPSPLTRGAGPGAASAPSHVLASPTKASPRKRKVVLSKKSVIFTPKKKKSPSKRRVQWKDDVGNGSLAEFAKTPQKINWTPDTPRAEMRNNIDNNNNNNNNNNNAVAAVQTASDAHLADSPGASPVPTRRATAAATASDVRTTNSRFLTGFLSKKSDGSPTAPGPPSLSALPGSDSEQSPLRELEPDQTSNRLSSQSVEATAAAAAPPGHDTTANETTSQLSSSSSENEQNMRKGNGRSEAMRIKSAMKRASSAATSGSGAGTRAPHRRRSPGGASSNSPPNDIAPFTASHARRMVRGDKEDHHHNHHHGGGAGGLQGGSVLSPRTAPIIGKTGRRTTVGGGGGGGGSSDARQSSGSTGLAGREAVRLSAIANSGVGSSVGSATGGPISSTTVPGPSGATGPTSTPSTGGVSLSTPSITDLTATSSTTAGGTVPPGGPIPTGASRVQESAGVHSAAAAATAGQTSWW